MWFQAAVTVLAVARLTRLVATDQITKPWRDNLARRRPERWSDGLYCRWCASIWVAALVIPTVWWTHGSAWVLAPASALACSHLTGLLVRAEPRD